jgi:hypothetical protein
MKDADLISGETIAIDGFLKLAKIQFLVKTNFVGKGTCAYSGNFGTEKHDKTILILPHKKRGQ